MTRHDPEIEELREKVHCAGVLERTPPCWKLDRKESTKLSLTKLHSTNPLERLNNETCARLGVFGAFCALWLFIVAERRGALAAVRLAVAIARICQAAARIREQRLIL